LKRRGEKRGQGRTVGNHGRKMLLNSIHCRATESRRGGKKKKKKKKFQRDIGMNKGNKQVTEKKHFGFTNREGEIRSGEKGSRLIDKETQKE